ncbi:uncharacterized protein LOC111223482 [Seriola dumerili]|uniref:Uncharacterized LOC111223482 n=1 Tax=Seriola dumerili TaxID=41447 RepID=A0A3B4T681_SERDU|nr:uncharacterized protein LOC111223482 [Seriola dumerili]
MRNLSSNCCLLAAQQFGESYFPCQNGKRGPAYLSWVLDCVSKCKGKRISLQNPADATLIIGDLEDTIYRERPDEVNGWGKFYLPKTVTMQVIGVVEGTSCPCDQLVLMTCEDKKLYAYDGEELHLVASSLHQLWTEGIKFSASKSYYHGEAFKHMTKQDWADARKGPVGRRLDEEHHKLVLSKKSSFMENLRIARQRAVVL